MKKSYPILMGAMTVALAIGVVRLGAQSATIAPIKDNTLFEDSGGTRSNGAGQYLFTGKTNNNEIRRALLAFDIASHIPANATITQVQLTLNMSKTATGSQTVSLHRLNADWGEGASDASSNEGAGATAMVHDATWLHTFFNTLFWSIPGGDFVPTASASADVGGNGPYTWASTAELIADVQHWLDQPTENFGWIVIGNESAAKTAKRFDSKEHPTTSNRPLLSVSYTEATFVEEWEAMPTVFALHPVFPNPFNPTAQILFDTIEKRQIRLHVYDIRGRTVCSLVNGLKMAGRHRMEWNGRDARGAHVASGVYLIVLDNGVARKTQKVVLSR